MFSSLASFWNSGLGFAHMTPSSVRSRQLVDRYSVIPIASNSSKRPLPEVITKGFFKPAVWTNQAAV